MFYNIQGNLLVVIAGIDSVLAAALGHTKDA
jgi:hypothetical protein